MKDSYLDYIMLKFKVFKINSLAVMNFNMSVPF